MRLLKFIGVLTVGLVLAGASGASALPFAEIHAMEGPWEIGLPQEASVPLELPGLRGRPAVVPPTPVTPAGQGQHPLGGPLGAGGLGVAQGVPEPGLSALLLLGLAGLLRSTRRVTR